MENLDNIKVTVIEKNACTVTASSVMVGLPTLVGPAGPQGPQGPAGPSGGVWGEIEGTLSNQTDLQDTLDLKANTADLGEMAEVDDAPSDDEEYVRKNGAWAVSSGGGGAWGEITGTLSDQTDLQAALDAKQNTLTFDSTPTNGSSNPVTSDGIYDALATKQSTLTFDSAPTASSTNPVTSGGIKTALDSKANNSILADAFSPSTTYAIGDYCIAYDALYRFTSAHTGNWAWADVTQVVAMNELEALQDDVDALNTEVDGKQDTLTFDTTPTASSTNPVTSGGIKTYADNKILYFYEQSTSVTSASTAEFCRVTDSRIDANTVVLNMSFSDSSYITSGISWTSATGYISLKGICTNSLCKVNIVLGQKGN